MEEGQYYRGIRKCVDSIVCVLMSSFCLPCNHKVKDKLEEIQRIKQGEPDADEIAAAKEAQNQRNKQVLTTNRQSGCEFLPHLVLGRKMIPTYLLGVAHT